MGVALGKLIDVMQERQEFTPLGSTRVTERLGRGMGLTLGEYRRRFGIAGN